MPKFEMEVQVADWMKTPEFAARLDAAKEAQDRANRVCADLLREIDEDLSLSAKNLAIGMMGSKLDRLSDEDRECVEYFAEEVKRALKAQREANNELGNALWNKPKQEETK